MTTAAWVMLGATWSVIAFFAGKFLLAVIRTPPREATGREEGSTGST